MLSQKLKSYNLILASSSPRRKTLLEDLGVDFKVKKLKNVDESIPAGIDKVKAAEYLALLKAKSLLIKKGEIYITADTIVCLDKLILNKPENYNEALKMLNILSGKVHEVITAVCIRSSLNTKTFISSTRVWFKNLNIEEINYYIKTFKPFDKAGGYGIQEWIGYIGVEKIEGSYFNVMGLPVQRLYIELQKFIEQEENY